MGKITEYPTVDSLDDNDKLFVNVNGHLKQVAKIDAGISGGGGSVGNAKMKMVGWGTELVVDNSNVISFLFMFGGNVYSIWIPSTDEVHLRDLYVSDEQLGSMSITHRDRTLGINFTVTREPAPSKKITITSESNMTMSIWYS